MRYTHKLDKPDGNCNYFLIPDKEQCDNAENKLGQLEDIEDELGIDLITLFTQATKEVWYKKEISCYDTGGNWYKKLDSSIIIHNSIVSRLDFQHKLVYIKGAKEWHSIENYGKTWALTKEELL